MDGPLNIESSKIKFSPFSAHLDLITTERFTIKKRSTGVYEANHDFGVVSLGDDFYSLNRLIFIRKSETAIDSVNQDLEMQIYGNSRLNKKLVLSVLFKLSKHKNPNLLKLGIGNGALGSLLNHDGTSSVSKTIEKSFNLRDFIGKTRKYLKYEGSTTEYPCHQATWLIPYKTIGISKDQLKEFPAMLRYPAKQATKDQQIFQNVDKDLKELKLPHVSSGRERIFMNVVLESQPLRINFEPQFMNHDKIMKSVLKSKYSKEINEETGEIREAKKRESQYRKHHKGRSKSSRHRKGSSRKKGSFDDKSNRKNLNMLFNRFEIYFPKMGKHWGLIPNEAIYPWEISAREHDSDKRIFKRKDLDVPSPKSGYHYISLFYSRTSSKFKMDDGRFVYIPYLVLVKSTINPMRFPTTSLTIWDPSTKSEKKIKIHRLTKAEMNNGGKIERRVSAQDIINRSKQMTSLANNMKGGSRAIGVAQQEVKPVLPTFNGLSQKEIMLREKMILEHKQNLIKKMIKKISKNDRKIRQKFVDVLPDNKKMPDTGGYDIFVEKDRTPAQKQIKRLRSLLSGIEETGAQFIPAITTATTVFPMMSCKPGEYPFNAVLVNQKLPKNAVVLKMLPPIAPAVDSKYILYFYVPVDYKTRWGQKVYVPNYILVPQEFGIPLNSKKMYPLHLPAVLAVKGSWANARIERVKEGRIGLSYRKIVMDSSVLKLPKKESGRFLAQGDFNLMMWSNNKPHRSIRERVRENRGKIVEMLKELGSKVHHKHKRMHWRVDGKIVKRGDAKRMREMEVKKEKKNKKKKKKKKKSWVKYF